MKLANRTSPTRNGADKTGPGVSPSVVYRRRARIIALVESLPGASANRLGDGHLSIIIDAYRLTAPKHLLVQLRQL